MRKQTRPRLLITTMAALLAAASCAHSYQSYSSSSSSITTTTIRLKANRLRRPESCREQLPRKSEDLPALVIVGRVKEVYLAGGEQPLPLGAVGPNNQPATTTMQPLVVGSVLGLDAPSSNKALVTIGRVIKGNAQLLGSDIIVSGFNSTSSMPCPNYVKPNDTLILLLNHEGERKYAIQGANLLAMNLNNIERVNAIAADEPYKRRGPIEDILCEAHYCPYGRCVVLSEQPASVTCKCPDSCSALPAPVCGSDNVTYPSECHLIREGCRIKRPLFITKTSSC